MRLESRMKREFMIKPQRAFSLQRTEGVRGWGTVCCSVLCKGPHSARAGQSWGVAVARFNLDK